MSLRPFQKEAVRTVAEGVGVHVYRTTNQSIPDNSSTAIEFDAVSYNPVGMWNAGTPVLITIPCDGYYLVAATVGMDAGGAVGQRTLFLVQPSIAVVGVASFDSNAVLTIPVTTILKAKKGDALSLEVLQVSGGALDALAFSEAMPSLSVHRLT